MKNAIVIVVLLFVFKPLFPVAEYVFNYDYIAKELCENKAKPEMKCNGKCHLMKELAKASDNENPMSSDKKVSQQEFEVLFLPTITSFEICTFLEPISMENHTIYHNLYSYDILSSVFHPPSFIV